MTEFAEIVRNMNF